MKLLLQILWGWSVLANGAVGIQVGTIQTNNQNIKLMKMNFTSPVWLQSASNVGGEEYITFTDAIGNPELELYGSKMHAISTYMGNTTTQEIPDNVGRITIQSDADTEITILGKITYFGGYLSWDGSKAKISSIDVTHAKSLKTLRCMEGTLTHLDVSKNTELIELKCDKNQLTSIDVSNNTKLERFVCNNNQLTSVNIGKKLNRISIDLSNNQITSFYCASTITSISLSNNRLTQLTLGDFVPSNPPIYSLSNNETILSINILSEINIEAVASSISNLISSATSVDGVITLCQEGEYNQTIIDAAMEKGWDVQYAD